MSVLGLAKDLEARAFKRKLERRRVPRKMGDGDYCRDCGSGTVGVERIGSDGKHEAFSLIRAR